MTWSGLSGWWFDELAADPAYEEEVAPLVVDLLRPGAGLYLDVGCGEGRLMTLASCIGVDEDPGLLTAAARRGPVVRGRLPDLGFLADRVFEGAFVSLVLEHVDRHDTLLGELARVVRPGGVLVVVSNHPMFTAPGSAPVQDEDGEVLWRMGDYLRPGHTDEPAGTGTVRFHHRTTADLLTCAAAAGWDLERLVERGVGERQVERYPPLGAQRNLPRLLGARWRRRAPGARGLDR